MGLIKQDALIRRSKMADEIKEETLEERLARYKAEYEARQRQWARERKERHDRLLKDYGIETEHQLTEIDPEEHFDFVRDYGYYKIKRMGNNKDGFDWPIWEHCEGVKHLYQGGNWQPKLIEGTDSPYVLTEQEKLEAERAITDNEVRAELKRIDESIANREKHGNKDIRTEERAMQDMQQP